MKNYNIKTESYKLIKNVVAALNSKNTKFKIKGNLEEINISLNTYIIPKIKDYWFQYITNEDYIISINKSEEEYYFKEFNEYGYSCKRYILDKNNNCILADKNELKELEIKQKLNLFCKVICQDKILEEQKVNDIKDFIFFIKKNLLNLNKYDEKIIIKLKELIKKILKESMKNFDIEVTIYENKIKFKYFLDRESKEQKIKFDIKDKIFLGNILRIINIEFEKINNSQINSKKSKRINLLIESSRTPKTAKELMDIIGLKDRETFYNNYLKPAIKKGDIKYTIPDKPRSPKQKYVINDENN